MNHKLGTVVLILTLALPTAGVAPAYADNEPCSNEGACQNRSGDCRETEEGSYCSDDDFSPSFDKSPVDHSFNPTICVMPGSCAEKQQPASFFPPDPTKIGEYLAAGFKLGSDFALALTTVIVTFVSSLGQFMA